MCDNEKLDKFLRNFITSQRIEWLELFLFEYRRVSHNSPEIASKHDKFASLSCPIMSYQLMKMLLTNIRELMMTNELQSSTRDELNVVLSLRSFLTCGLGSRIIATMSDLDLSAVTNGRELTSILTKIFPSECWDVDNKESHLKELTNEDIFNSYKKLKMMRHRDDRIKILETAKNQFEDVKDLELEDYENFMDEEFKKSVENYRTASAQLAQNVIRILSKLCELDNSDELCETDQNSITMRCLNFSLDTLTHLFDQQIFTENDQTVIKFNLMDLMIQCFRNLVNRDGKSIEIQVKKLLHLLELSDDNRLSCGIILVTFCALNNVCVKNSSDKSECMKLFLLCHHVVLRQMKILATDRELLHIIQTQLLKILKILKNLSKTEIEKMKKKPKFPKKTRLHHSIEKSDCCIFEKILIESLPMTKKFSDVRKILFNFKHYGVCCCNVTIDSIKVFFLPSTIPIDFLKLVECKMFRVIFQGKPCQLCMEKMNSDDFKNDLFDLQNLEINRRQGWELRTFLHFLKDIQKHFDMNQVEKFLAKVAIPTFQRSMKIFNSNPDEFQESKVIATHLIVIIKESLEKIDFASKFISRDMIRNLQDCSLIPSMAENSCQLIKIAYKNLGSVEDEKDREKLEKSLNLILFSNVLFLTRELVEIYNQLDLPKDVPLTSVSQTSDKSETNDFEILDEKFVAIKEILSDMDVLLLNTIHWKILSELIAEYPNFQREFVVNIYNNFSGNILFTVAYNAMNSILLKKEVKNSNPPVMMTSYKTLKSVENQESPQILERCEYLSPVIIKIDHLKYQEVLRYFEDVYDTVQTLSKTLKNDENFYIFDIQKKPVKFICHVHRDNFLEDEVIEAQIKLKSKTDELTLISSESWFNELNHIWSGFSEAKDRIYEIVTKFRFLPEEELRVIHRFNLIREVTVKSGLIYFSSIARDCFDICWRLSDNLSFSSKMSLALGELKILLLQDNWDESQDAMVEALQLLLGVAEMKTKNGNRLMLLDDNHLRSSSTESMFSDIGSSREKLMFDCYDEDDHDNTSSDKTETLYTADENYDGDEEYYSVHGDTECSQSFRSCTMPASLSFRNTNEHICRLVVEVLMDLSRRCVEKPDQWQPNSLIYLVHRLSCMKSYLGGSDFLLRGFAPILQTKSQTFKDLQNAILELIDDLSSPESLKAFLSVLTVNTAVVEQMIKRLEILCNKDHALKPSMKVKFPTLAPDSIMTSNCDTNLHQRIKSFREVHLSNKMLTPFTEASQIIPLNNLDFKPWNSQGFTISLWMEREAYSGQNQSHLVSVGSEKLMLVIYINGDGSFTVTVMKPNQNFSDGAKFNKTFNSNKENVNRTNSQGIGLASVSASNAPNIRHRGFMRNIMKKNEDENSKRLKTSKICVKSKRLKVKANRWTHVCFSVKSNETEVTLLLTINGTEQEFIEIQIDGMRENDVKEMLHLLCIGTHKSSENNNFKYSISNLILFRSPLEPPVHTSFLFSLGPDCNNFIDCEGIKEFPLSNLLDVSKSYRRKQSFTNQDEIAARLKFNALMIYSVGKVMGYEIFDHGKPMSIFTVGRLPKPQKVASIAKAIENSGGLSTLLFLFARVVEMTDDPPTQSRALSIFLKMSHCNNHLYSEFEQKNLFNLVAHVFLHSNCYRGPGMLKAILDVVYGGTMFEKKSMICDDFVIDEHSHLNIQNPRLLLKLLERFNIFQSNDKSEVEILDLLFKTLTTVVREQHENGSVNRQRLIENDFYEKLIEFCKIHLTNSSNSISISPTTALAVVHLMKVLVKDPPPKWSLIEIQKLLLLLHHPSESFITHDRTKFNYFLASSKPHKRFNLNPVKPSKIFNFSLKIRSSPKSPTHPAKSPKSPGDPMSQSSDSNSSSKAMKTSMKKIKVRKLDEFSEGEFEKITKAFADSKNKKESKTPKGVHLRRLKSTPKMSPYKKVEKVVKKIELDFSDDDQNLAKTFESLMNAVNKTSIMPESEIDRYETGVSILQENLFKMLSDTVMFLDDQRVETDLPEFMNIEMLIMFANHSDPNARAALIELAHMLVTRQTSDTIAKFEKQNLWIHFGNQLAMHPVNMKMVQACSDWICCRRLPIQQIPRMQKVEFDYKPALGLLVAMIPAMVHDFQVMIASTKFLRFILNYQPDVFTQTNLNHLTASLTKALIKSEKGDVKVKEAIMMTMEQIATRALISSNSLQALWDLLYGFTFVERNKKMEIIREVHLTILRQLLSHCLVENSGGRRASWSGSYFIVQTLGNLQSNDIKSRFNAILERAVHFTMTWNIEEKFSTLEIDFVTFLLELIFSGFHQNSSLILWSLNPQIDEKIRNFSIEKILKNLNSNIQIPGNDLKLVRSLLMEFLNSSPSHLPEDSLKLISNFCGTSLSQQQQSWSWSRTAMDKIESIHDSSLMDQILSAEKIVYRYETLVQTIIDSAMKMTRNVVDKQNKERRLLMNELKQMQEIDFYREWYELIQRMIHEEAPWYNEDLYPSTWELDETEGPNRIRIRLKRSVLNIEERFFNEEFQQKSLYCRRKRLLEYLIKPNETEKYSIRDRIAYTFNGKHLTLEQEIDGEIIITDFQLIFLANRDSYTNSIICDVKSIREVWNRRYQHKKIALEFFLDCRKTFFIIFETNYDRDIAKKFIDERLIEKKKNDEKDLSQKKWVDGRLTNFEYLIELNKRAGRSYNDLMQYPVFPWILNDYESEELNLNNPQIYRRLNKTISTQHDDLEQHYISNYNYLAQSIHEQPSIMRPYHYSSHYSNSGTILHFLVRLPPFTNMFLIYQDHNFDIPDRTFHSMATTFRLTSKESATDVKELIPEFFYLFDFLENSEGFDFGKRQSGEAVNDVKLPAWCENNSRLFMLIHRQALESEIVRKSLNQWIDLIFGIKQKGNAAIDAINVFHPATYPDFQIANITDPVERSAYETMIRTYGQMPKQIFTALHKKSHQMANDDQTISTAIEYRPVLKTVKGLRWGTFTGSPHLPKPKKLHSFACNSKQLISLYDSNIYYGLPQRFQLIKSTNQKFHDLVIWSESDGIVRVKNLKDLNEKPRKLFHISNSDPVTACGSHVKHSNLWFGHESGIISVFTRSDEIMTLIGKKKNLKTFNETFESIIGIKDDEQHDDEETVKSHWNYPIRLVKHKSPLIDIMICAEFDVVVSISVDGRTTIWDARKIEYIRTIEPSCNTLQSHLSIVDISPTLGDILTIFTPKGDSELSAIDDENLEVTDGDDFINVSMAIRGKSQLRLHTINAKYINHTFTQGFATAACFSYIKEGTGVNVIAVGFDDGKIRLFSSWTLDLVREIATGLTSPINQLIFTINQHLVFLANQEIQIWGSEGLIGEIPKFHRYKLD